MASDIVQWITQRRGVRQFVKFGIVGASGFAVNLAVFTLLQSYLAHTIEERHQRYLLNFSLAFMAGGVSNYFLNRIWTFRASGHPVVQGLQFLGVSALALGVGLVVSHFLTPYLGPGHRTWFVATLSGMVVNFFVNKYWTFRSGD